MALPPPPPPPAAPTTTWVPPVAAAGQPPWRRPLFLGLGVAAATAYTALFNPDRGGPFPLCPLKLVTGLDCPFCGGLRATHALAHGHLAEAASHNVLFVAAVPFLVVAWALWMARSLGWTWRGRPLPRWGRPKWTTYALVGVPVAFMVVRNLGGPFHWLGSTA